MSQRRMVESALRCSAGSSGNTFGGNKAVGNVLEGFNVDASSSNEFTRNTADRNLVGFWVGNGSAANGSTKNSARRNSTFSRCR